MIDPLLLKIPEEIQTDQLIIRAPQVGDGALVRPVVLANQEYLKAWMPWAVNVPTAEEYEIWARKRRLAFLAREELPLMLLWRETGQYIGGSGVHDIKWEVPKFEIGYWIAQEFEGRGLVLEAVNAITTFLFETLNANRVEIRCDVNNVRSAAVARRAGYTHEGTLIHNARHHLTNELRSTHLFAKTREE